MMYFGFGEETTELRHAVAIINKLINRGALVYLTDKHNNQFSVKLDREIDIVVADFINLLEVEPSKEDSES